MTVCPACRMVVPHPAPANPPTTRRSRNNRKSVLAQAALAAEQAANAAKYSYPPAPLPGGPDYELVIAYPAPTPPKSMNQTAGQHWSATNGAKNKWQEATSKAFAAHADALAPFRGHRVELTFALPVHGGGRRDAHNYIATCKWAVDGITQAQVLFPDDNTTWVSVAEPVLWVNGPEVRVRIRVATPNWDPSTATPLP